MKIVDPNSGENTELKIRIHFDLFKSQNRSHVSTSYRDSHLSITNANFCIPIRADEIAHNIPYYITNEKIFFHFQPVKTKPYDACALSNLGGESCTWSKTSEN